MIAPEIAPPARFFASGADESWLAFEIGPMDDCRISQSFGHILLMSKATHGREWASDILEEIRNGKRRLVQVWDTSGTSSPRLALSMTWVPNRYRRMTCALIDGVGGEDVKNLAAPALVAFCSWCAAQGFGAVEGTLRPGWRDFLPAGRKVLWNVTIPLDAPLSGGNEKQEPPVGTDNAHGRDERQEPADDERQHVVVDGVDQ